MDPKTRIGTTQFKSIKKPNNRLPISAPPRPKVKAKAAAITLKLVGNISTMTQYTALIPREVKASKIQHKVKFCSDVRTKYNIMVATLATTRLKTVQKIKQLILNNFKSVLRTTNLRKTLHLDDEHRVVTTS